jgi:hypothetical protein
MSTVLAAEEGGSITPGEHWTAEVGGLTFNLDTIIGTLIAGSSCAAWATTWPAAPLRAARPGCRWRSRL